MGARYGMLSVSRSRVWLISTAAIAILYSVVHYIEICSSETRVHTVSCYHTHLKHNRFIIWTMWNFDFISHSAAELRLTLCSMLVCALLKYHSKHTYPLKDRTHGLIPYHFDRESKSCFVCILSRPVVSTCGHSCSVIYSQCRTVSLGVSDPNLLWPFYFSEFDYHSMSPRASSSILAMTLLAILQYDTKRLLENWSKQDTTSATQTVTRCPCGRFGSW